MFRFKTTLPAAPLLSAGVKPPSDSKIRASRRQHGQPLLALAQWSPAHRTSSAYAVRSLQGPKGSGARTAP